MSTKGSALTALSVLAIVLAAAALAVNFAIPGPQGLQGPPGPEGAQGPAGPTGIGLSPRTQQLTIALGEGKIIQEIDEKDELTGEYHRWEPNTLVVKKGDTVELTVVNPRKAVHSFVLSAYNIDTGAIPGRNLEPDEAKRTVTVTFVADKAGVFKFECGTPFEPADGECDPDHATMTGYLVVLEV